jgi:hypothetical protein
MKGSYHLIWIYLGQGIYTMGLVYASIFMVSSDNLGTMVSELQWKIDYIVSNYSSYLQTQL